MKFSIGDKARVIATGRIGQIKHYKHEIFYYNGVLNDSVRYAIYFPNSYGSNWYDEHELALEHDYTFDDKFEIAFLDFLIDIYLDHRKLDVVKQLFNEKQNIQRSDKND